MTCTKHLLYIRNILEYFLTHFNPYISMKPYYDVYIQSEEAETQK